ncbi:hypothetical protein K8B05_14350 [Listeria monocytogenes]|nr:hypothetical protein [Listeria monocytogenes]
MKKVNEIQSWQDLKAWFPTTEATSVAVTKKRLKEIISEEESFVSHLSINRTIFQPILKEPIESIFDLCNFLEIAYEFVGDPNPFEMNSISEATVNGLLYHEQENEELSAVLNLILKDIETPGFQNVYKVRDILSKINGRLAYALEDVKQYDDMDQPLVEAWHKIIYTNDGTVNLGDCATVATLFLANKALIAIALAKESLLALEDNQTTIYDVERLL